MSKYKEVILPIVQDANVKTYQIAAILSVVGIAILGCSVGFLEVGTLRTIGVIAGIVLMALPFALRLFLDQHKKVGVIRFSEYEILTKLNDEKELIHDVMNINSIEFDIVDFEGETKTRDLARSSSTMNVRTGSENQVFWKSNDEEFHFKFKLSSELQKRQVMYFLKLIESQISK